MHRLLFRGLNNEAIEELRPFAEYSIRPFSAVEKSGAATLTVQNGEVAHALWPFVKKWGTKTQLEKLRAALKAAGITPPRTVITADSDIAELDIQPGYVRALKQTNVISVVGDLTNSTSSALFKLPGIGPGIITQVRRALAQEFLRLADER